MDQIWTPITEAAKALTWIEIGAVVFSLLYVVFAARARAICWIFGIIGCVLWAYAAFVLYDLWIDGLLQVFYVGISFLGIYQWKYGGAAKKELGISSMSVQEHGMVIIGGLLLTVPIGYFFAEYTPAAATYIDAFTTVFSIICTFLVIQKKLENWLYWVVIDLVYIYLYVIRGGYLFALLFVLYVLIALRGYFAWKVIWKNEKLKDVA